MRPYQTLLTAVSWMLLLGRASATVFYVDVNSANPTPPYADWSTASTDIQSAIDAASVGDLILVTNGVYQTGGRVVYGSLTNRVVIDKAVTVQSVNGPNTTSIQGNQPYGESAIRCAYLTNNAMLIGFTLTNGATRFGGASFNEQNGGGAWCESSNAIIVNCIFANNSVGWSGGAASGGTLSNCIVTGNFGLDSGGGVVNCTAYGCAFVGNMAPIPTPVWNSPTPSGGAASKSTLFNCVLSNNLAFYGGGAYSCVLSNCVLIGNIATNYGGGAYLSTLDDCQVLNNLAANGGVSIPHGGGVEQCTLNNCILIENTVSNSIGYGNPTGQYATYGGGADNSTLKNCVIAGNQAIGLVSVSSFTGGGVNNSTLNNCMINSNSASVGGGVANSKLNKCVIAANISSDSGGGAYSSTLTNCLIINNTTRHFGGGAMGGVLVNCTIVSNSQTFATFLPVYAAGGGVENSVVKSSVLYDNISANVTNSPNYYSSQLTNCCTIPMPTNGVANFTNDPAFVNLASADYHLQSNSPCINSGNDTYVIDTNDLDGNARIVGGTVDIGAYEYQTPSSLLSYAWAQQYGLPTDGSADYVDTDGDGLNNWQEWIAGTVPTNAASVLELASPSNSVSGLMVTWQSVSGVTYYLQSSTNLPAFTSIASNLVGQAGTTSYTDTTATNAGPYYYRVGVQ